MTLRITKSDKRSNNLSDVTVVDGKIVALNQSASVKLLQ